MKKSSPKKIVLLNETTLDSMMEKDSGTIIKNFTETGITIMEADFGFAWWKFRDEEKYTLVYKSPNTPYEPTYPREKAGNYIARKTKRPFVDSSVKKENYTFDINKYLRSYIIIPIYYKEVTYGSLVFCYKKKHVFTKDEIDLATILGTTTAQAITIHRLVETELEIRMLSEKQESELKAMEEERLKVESIADATHELRTPLAIIRGNVDLALMESANAKNKGKNTYRDKALHNIDKEVTNLTNIISDLALLTSEGGQLKDRINRDIVNVSELVTDITNRLKHINPKKNISIQTKIEKDSLMIGDKTYLEKLFSNLVRNAITYGKNNGWIKVFVSRKKNSVHIEVKDNGIGISPEDLPYVFNRFYRADKSHNSDGKRTGLGLAIAKWVTNVHGGTLSAKSTLGKGSIFTVSLPTKTDTKGILSID